EPDGFAVCRLRLLVPALAAQGNPQAGVCLCEVRLEPDGLAVCRLRLLVPALAAQCIPQVVVGTRAAASQRHRRGQETHRLLVLRRLHLAQARAQVVVEPEVAGVRLPPLPQHLLRRLRLPALLEYAPQQRQRDGRLLAQLWRVRQLHQSLAIIRRQRSAVLPPPLVVVQNLRHRTRPGRLLFRRGAHCPLVQGGGQFGAAVAPAQPRRGLCRGEREGIDLQIPFERLAAPPG